jgi:hypothetical protein
MTSVRNKIIPSAALAFFIVFFISIPAFFVRAQEELSRSGVKISPALFQESGNGL